MRRAWRSPKATGCSPSREAGGDDALDSDIDAAGITEIFVYTEGDVQDTNDAGYLPAAG